MERREPPPTEEGWYALHDFRTVDWNAWRAAAERDREDAIAEGTDFLHAAEAHGDSDPGGSVTYAVNGHKADLLVIHLRPTLDELNYLERRFEQTVLAEFTDRSHSYVSVTEVSGYTSDELFEEGEIADIEDTGLRNYLEMRLHPTIPEADYVCFYPLDKRREPEQNWYDLPFEERAEHMASHGEIGRDYAGEVTQMITGSIGFDDWEWGVTLWSNDPTAFKRLLYEMRFDPSTSRFATFGPFYTGERLAPGQLGAFLAGDRIGEGERDDGETSADGPPEQVQTGDDAGDIRGELADMDIYAGQPHGEDVHAMVLYSEADTEELFEEVRGLRANFDHYDTHVKTAVYADQAGDLAAVVSLWETERAAQTAGGFLSELPGIVSRAGEESGFGTMGMFYTVKPEHRVDFVETFDDVGGVLADMDGHVSTSLFVNHEDENDMFISSQWRSKDDAMEFFRSEDFSETVSWGRDVLADRPRHVFLA